MDTRQEITWIPVIALGSLMCLIIYAGIISDAEVPEALHESATVPIVNISSSNDTLPGIHLKIEEAKTAGWNVHVETEGFFFAGADAEQEFVSGQGYVNLTIDGEEIARMHDTLFHLASLPSGMHQVRATLHASNHSPLAYNDVLIASEEMLTVPW